MTSFYRRKTIFAARDPQPQIYHHFLRDFELEKNKKTCCQALKFKMAAEIKMDVKKIFILKFQK
jgi:hypothetical protein